MVKWNIDKGVKRVSVDAAVHNDISNSYTGALLLVFPHPYDSLCVAIEVFENSVPRVIFGPQKGQNRMLGKLHKKIHNCVYILCQII